MENKRENILDILKKISDLSFQKEVWLDQKYWDRVLNFDEAVNTLDDYGFFDDIRNRVYNLSKSEYENLISFERELDEYDSDQQSVSEMLEDENWIKVTKRAEDVYNLLASIDISDD